MTGASRPVALRPGSTYSVILAVFANEALDSHVTLAQVFWLRDTASGPPERLHVTSDRALSIGEHFTGFGADVNDLRKRLRRLGQVHDTFKAYAKDFRRRLGIESEQAMELFHQTVSMKSVGDLNDFVRGHMLEPFDSADWVKRLVEHFEDLTKAHEAVTRARAQLAALEPLLADCAAYDEHATAVHRLDGMRAALPYALAERKVDVLTGSLTQVGELVDQLERELADVKHRLDQLRRREQDLVVERAGNGGDRLARIADEIERLQTELHRRRRERARVDELLLKAQLPPLGSAAQLAARVGEARRLSEILDAEIGEVRRAAEALVVERHGLEARAQDLNAELVSLQARRTNIPRTSQELRAGLCDDLGLDVATVPFVAELLQVRPEHASWEGVAERVLHGFALSLLVPQEHYVAVSEWINERHLGARVVY